MSPAVHFPGIPAKLGTITLLLALVALPASAVTVTVDANTQYQTIQGFGSSLYGGAVGSDSPFLDPTFRQIYAHDLGCSIVRMEVYPGYMIAPGGSLTGPEVTLGSDINANAANWSLPSVLVSFHQWLATNALEPNRVKFMASIWSPPHWAKQQASYGTLEGQYMPAITCGTGCTAGGTWKDTYFQYNARYISSFVKAYQNAVGHPLYALSIQNEVSFENPFNSCTLVNRLDASGNAIIDNARFAQCLKAVKDEFSLHPELTTKIMGPHMANVGPDPTNPWGLNQQNLIIDAVKTHSDPNLDDFMQIYTNNYDANPPNVARCNAAYWSGKQNVAGSWASYLFCPGIAADGKESWNSEAGGESPIWPGPLELADNAQSALVYGNQSAYIYWQTADGRNSTENETLLSTSQFSNPHSSKKYCAYKHFSRYIRPGSKRVKMTFANGTPSNGGSDQWDTTNATFVSAYTHTEDGRVTMVIVNSRSVADTLTITVPTYPNVTTYQQFRTSETENFATLSNLTVSGGTIDVSVPAKSIVTLTGMASGGGSQGTFGNNGNPWSIASTGTTRIETENYDTGGQGIAYHDADATNNGGQYRTSEGVDVEATTDTGGGHNVGWVSAGEWLEYTVNVASAGTYDLNLRVARQPTGTSTVRVLFDGVDKTGSMSVPSTGAWQTFTTITASGVSLSAGQQVMRVDMTGGDYNVNWVEFTAIGGSGGSADIAAGTATIDATVEAAWNNATAQSVNNLSGTITNSSDCSGTWKGLWDSTNLYVLADVTDDNKSNDSTNAWEDDSVEIYLDGNNDKTTSYDSNDRQIICGWGDSTPVEGAGRSITGVSFVKADPTSNSYRIEAKVPWGTLGVTKFAGQLIGIDIHFNDDDAGGLREGKKMWNDTTDTAWSNPSVFGTATLVGSPPPAAPTGLEATAGDAQVSLSWNASTGATSYNVKRSTTSGSGYGTVGTSTDTSHTDTGLTNGTTYYYVVSAVNSGGESGNSSQVSATPRGGPVAAPTFSPAAGTYTSAQSVTISTATSGASIRYTTNGTDPTSTTGTLYSGPVNISVTTTLKAIAFKSGMTDSSITSGTYAINPASLFANAGFESGLTGWTNTGNSAITTDAASGSQAVVTGPGEGGVNQQVSYTSGAPININVKTKVSGTLPGWSGIGIDFLNSSGAELGEVAFQVTATTYTSWVLNNQAVPAGTASLRFWTWKPGTTGNLFVDDVVVTQQSSSWTVLTYDDFESGFGSYTDGGADCVRYTGGSANAHQGVAALNIQDNSGAASSFYHTSGHNVTDYSQLRVTFWYKAVSMESGEDFLLEYSSNGGSNWQVVDSWVSGTDFSNDQFNQATVFLDSGSYSFSTNAKLRFRCDASADNDDVFVDEVELAGQ